MRVRSLGVLMRRVPPLAIVVGTSVRRRRSDMRLLRGNTVSCLPGLRGHRGIRMHRRLIGILLRMSRRRLALWRRLRMIVSECIVRCGDCHRVAMHRLSWRNSGCLDCCRDWGRLDVSWLQRGVLHWYAMH